MKKHLPNLATLMNLASGTISLVFALEGNREWAVYFILAAAFFDFLDGMLARLLHAYSDTGKQLDSLADMVSFGVVPAVFVYAVFRQQLSFGTGIITEMSLFSWILLGSILIIPVFSAIRLARFNLDASGSEFFTGLPTPAHTLFWTGIYWQFMSRNLLFGQEINLIFLWIILIFMAIQMILPVPMYSLKFKHFRFRGNMIRYLILVLSLVWLITTGIPGFSMIVLTYILLSLLNLFLSRRVSK